MKNESSPVRIGLSLGLISALRIFGLMIIVPILYMRVTIIRIIVELVGPLVYMGYFSHRTDALWTAF